jgi:uncharacterized protein YqgV (UPF0045/DUF77 family)
MLAELSIMPIGGDSHTSGKLAEILKLIDASGLPYQLTPTATCIEGKWEEIMESFASAITGCVRARRM